LQWRAPLLVVGLRWCAAVAAQGDINMEEVMQSVDSWLAHATHADTYTLTHRVLSDTVFKRGRRGTNE